jgi:hypothetical protein
MKHLDDSVSGNRDPFEWVSGYRIAEEVIEMGKKKPRQSEV